MAAVHASSFFKVLFGDFSQQLKLPNAFVRSFKGKPPCKCVLGVPSGETWYVKMEEDENGSLFFRGGWHKFVKDHCLEEGDFLVFYYSGKLKFDVIIYDESACEMDLEVSKRRSDARLAVETRGKQVMSEMTVMEEAPTGITVFKSKYSCFMKTFEYYRQYYMTIPKKLVRAEGLMEHEHLILQGPNKKSPKVVKTGMTGDGRMKLMEGWSELLKENNVALGDKLVLEFVKPGVVRVHIFRGKDVQLEGPKVVDSSNFRTRMIF